MPYAAPEDIVNVALIEAGQQRLIADLYEGSPAARAALATYGQTRDELLRARDWPFARRTLALTLLKGPPPPGGFNPNQPWTTAYPPPGWLYEYAYPSDCLKLGAIVAPPGLMFDLDPQPSVWRLCNDDTLSPAQQVILTNTSSAIAVYTGQITDPGTWNNDYTEALIKILASKLSKALLQGQMSAVSAKENLSEGAAIVASSSKTG